MKEERQTTGTFLTDEAGLAGAFKLKFCNN